MKRNALIDLFRFVCAFMVVLIHIRFPGDFVNGFIFPLTRMAVPFFFMVAGYFLADENAVRMKQKLNKQIKTVFWLFAGTMLVYFVYRLLFMAVQSPKEVYTIVSSLWNWSHWYRFLAINEALAFYAEHAWYLMALLYAMVIIRLMLEYHELKKLYWLAALSLLWVPLLIWQKGQGGDAPAALVRNYLTHGIPCLMAGTWIKCNTQQILKWPRKLVIALPVVLVLLTIAERWLFYLWLGYGDLSVSVSSLLLAASLIVLSIHFPKAGARTPFPKWGANYSLMIYIFHMIPVYTLNAMARAWGFQNVTWYRWGAPFVVFLLSFGFAVLWEGAKGKLKERKQAKIAAI